MSNKYIDTTLFDKAVKFATDAHANTERRAKGFPYLIHVMEAASITATMTNDQELLAAAMLHDVVEDTDITLDQIREAFGGRVADIVKTETDIREENGVELSWHEKKQRAMDRIKAAPIEGKMVAMGDKLSNMRAIWRDYQKAGDGAWSIFHESDIAAHEWHYRGLAESLKELDYTFAYKEFVYLIDMVFSDKGCKPPIPPMNTN